MEAVVERGGLHLGWLASCGGVFCVEVIAGPTLASQLALRGGNFTRAYAVVTAPFVHASIAHLINNTITLIWLGWLVALEGRRRFIQVSCTAGLTSGLLVIWLSPPGALTVGMSGVIFGYFGYLVTAALVERNWRTKLWRIFSVGVLLIWWGVSFLSGLIPQRAISWQGHLGGLLGGIMYAIGRSRRLRP
ncbi:MAG: rhomboid family intramembrane serine protease [Bowdeniella nasicola]|nr:rhomboid family intramembrane serine protease [Bowdeniella nasicola]